MQWIKCLSINQVMDFFFNKSFENLRAQCLPLTAPQPSMKKAVVSQHQHRCRKTWRPRPPHRCHPLPSHGDWPPVAQWSQPPDHSFTILYFRIAVKFKFRKISKQDIFIINQDACLKYYFCKISGKIHTDTCRQLFALYSWIFFHQNIALSQISRHMWEEYFSDSTITTSSQQLQSFWCVFICKTWSSFEKVSSKITNWFIIKRLSWKYFCDQHACCGWDAESTCSAFFCFKDTFQET